MVYSRIVGYYAPINNWNHGKREEFKDRRTYDITTCPSLIPPSPRTNEPCGNCSWSPA